MTPMDSARQKRRTVIGREMSDSSPESKEAAANPTNNRQYGKFQESWKA